MEQKVSEEVKLFEEMVEFMDKISVQNVGKLTIDDRKALSVACENVNDVHREMSAVILSSSLAVDVSLVVKDYISKVEEELNDICNKVSNLTIKVQIKDYVRSFQPDDAVIKDAAAAATAVSKDAAAAPYIAYLERRKKLMLESEDYVQTLELINKLKVIARKEQVSEKDLSILLRGYSMIMRVYRDLSRTINSDHSSSVWDVDVSLTINESRTKVENELNYMCNNMTDHAIKEDISQHLARFKAGHLPKKLLPLIVADRQRVSSQSEMKTTKMKSKLGSGDGEFRSDADYAFGYPNHRKRIKKQQKQVKQAESCYEQIIAIFGHWNPPEHIGKEIETQHASTVDDSSEVDFGMGEEVYLV